METRLLLAENIPERCRLCHSSRDREDFISPCWCTGTRLYVHRKCLDNRRVKNKAGEGFSTCGFCRFDFIIEPVVDDPAADERRLQLFHCLAIRNIIGIVLLIIGILLGFAFLFRFADSEFHTFHNLYSDPANAPIVYALSSLILFSVVLVIVGLFCAVIKWGLHGEFDQSSETYMCLSSLYYCTACFGASFTACDSGNGGDDGMGICILICVMVMIIVALALVLFFGLLSGIAVLFALLRLHTIRLWRRQETKKYVVKDLGLH